VIGGGLNDGLPRLGFDFLIVEYEFRHRFSKLNGSIKASAQHL
jgi:hypothetical protein